MNSIMDAVKGCLFRQWAMKSPMTPIHVAVALGLSP